MADAAKATARRWRRVLPKAENGQQSIVDAPPLLWAQTTNKVAQPAGVDGADLFNEYTRRLAEEIDLRTEAVAFPGESYGYRTARNRLRTH